MKSLICGYCNDIRSLRPKGATSCSCGHVTAWWVDAVKGIAKVKAADKEMVRILGMHNTFLQYAFSDELRRVTASWDVHEEWRKMHNLVTEHLSEGYLFNKIRRNCPFVLIRVGESQDVTWADPGEEPPKQE
jgi:hypothetical protein